MGQATYGQVRHEFEQRVMRGEFRAVEQTDGGAAPQYGEGDRRPDAERQ